MNLCFICTNFNSSDFTIKCINSLLLDNSEIVVFIVDNNSIESEKLKLKEKFNKVDKVYVEYSKSNLGYFKGLNKGINNAKKIKNFDLYIIGNNDLLFPIGFKDLLHKNKKTFLKYPVVSPGIYTIDGKPQNPHVVKNISTIRELIYNIYYFSYFLSRLIIKIANITSFLTRRKDEINNYKKAGEIWQGYGACYILSKKFFSHVDNELWSPSFICFEEFFLSKQLEKKGFKTYYLPELKITHLLHSSFKKVSNKVKWKYSRESFKIYRKYVKPFPLR